MTDEELFDKLFNGGNFSLPYLIKFSHPAINTIRLVNNNEDIFFDEHTYKAASFEYTPPDTRGKGASLKITSIDNTLIEFVENANYQYRLEVTGVITEGRTVQKISAYTHLYGTVSYNEDMQLQFQLGNDDRLEMTFPPYTYDTDNNRANA